MVDYEVGLIGRERAGVEEGRGAEAEMSTGKRGMVLKPWEINVVMASKCDKPLLATLWR